MFGTTELFLSQVGWVALLPVFIHVFLPGNLESATGCYVETGRVYATSGSAKSVRSVVDGLKAC